MKPNPRKAAAAMVSSSPRHRRGCADLHVHTTHSDGVCSPCEVVVAAARVGLMALAITDHDTVSALAVARPEALRWRVELIAGVELTCRQDGRELHILGYFIRDDDPVLSSAMAGLRAGRDQRIEAMVERLERAWAVDRPECGSARLPSCQPGSAPSCRCSHANASSGEYAGGVHTVPR